MENSKKFKKLSISGDIYNLDAIKNEVNAY